jgi:hypothetical protein
VRLYVQRPNRDKERKTKNRAESSGYVDAGVREVVGRRRKDRVPGRRARICQLRPQSPTRARGVNGSLLDIDRYETAKGMIMVEESSMTELRERAAVIEDNV